MESRYLLSGFAQCEACGGRMVVGTQDIKRHGRRPVYLCGYHRERGNAVSTNRLVAPVEVADRAVRAAIEHDVMRVKVVDTALEEALDLLRLSGTDIAGRRRARARSTWPTSSRRSRATRARSPRSARSRPCSASCASARRGATTSPLSFASSRTPRALSRSIHVRRNLCER
jgi:hypothetical protein